MRVYSAKGAAVQRRPLPGSKSAFGVDTLIDDGWPSLAAALGSATLDPVIDTDSAGLSKNRRARIKEGARDAVKSGVAKDARATCEAAGLKDSKGLAAIDKATEAAIQLGVTPR